MGQSVEKEHFKLIHWLLMVFENSFNSSSTKDTTIGISGPSSRLLRSIWPPWRPLQFARKSITVVGINQANPTLAKNSFHQVMAISQLSSKLSTYSLFFLNVQHQSVTMKLSFLRLSKVRIFSKEAVHTKKSTLRGGLVFQVFSMGMDSRSAQWETYRMNRTSLF